MPNQPEQEPTTPQAGNKITHAEFTPAEIDAQNEEADGIKTKAFLAATGIAAIGLTVAILSVDHARRKKEKEEKKDKKPRRTVREVLQKRFRRQK